MSQRDDSLNMFLSLRVKDEDKDNSHGDKQELVKEGGRMKGSCSLVSMLKKGQNIMGGGGFIHSLFKHVTAHFCSNSHFPFAQLLMYNEH